MLTDVDGLHDLMSNSLQQHLPAARTWCQSNGCVNVEDIVEAEFEEEFVAALGVSVPFQKTLLVKRLKAENLDAFLTTDKSI